MVGPEREVAEKQRRVLELAERHEVDGVVLTSLAAVAWFTGGADLHVARNSPEAVGWLVVTPERLLVLTKSNEAPRLSAEEFAGSPFEVVEHPWSGSLAEEVARLAGTWRLGTDNRALAADLDGVLYLGPELAALRYVLTASEVERYREVGRLAGQALEKAARAVERGMTEYQVAGLLDRELLARGLEPTVTLIAADDRLRRFRHPIPTERRVQESCMLITCARRYGLIAAATRIVHFGPLTEDLRRRHLAAVRVEVAALAATRPGARLGEIYERIAATYAAAGFAGEERLHHQGGAIGYENREYVAVPGSALTVHAPQAFAWNPSVAGTKSEDTHLVLAGPQEGAVSLECLTAGDGSWPLLEVTEGGLTLQRPDILVQHG